MDRMMLCRVTRHEPLRRGTPESEPRIGSLRHSSGLQRHVRVVHDVLLHETACR